MVDDAFVARKLVDEAVVAKSVVAVALVVLSEEMVPLAEVRSVMVVVANTDVEVAVNLPVTRLDVVAFVAVRLVKKEVSAVKTDVKKFVEVAFVVEAFVAKKLVEVLFTP